MMIVHPVDQARFIRLLNKVGGYDEVFRLNRELRAIKNAGKKPKLVRDATTKKYSVQADDQDDLAPRT